MFFCIEKVRRRQLSQRTEEMFNRVGIAILGVLFIFVFYNDIKRGRHFGQDETEAVTQSEEDLNKK